MYAMTYRANATGAGASLRSRVGARDSSSAGAAGAAAGFAAATGDVSGASNAQPTPPIDDFLLRTGTIGESSTGAVPRTDDESVPSSSQVRFDFFSLSFLCTSAGFLGGTSRFMR